MKRAILIGNSKYNHLHNLDCVSNDIQAMQEVLENAGYSVSKIVNGNYDEIKKFVHEFKENVSASAIDSFKDNVIFIYISGHGTVYNGNDCFLPTDFSGDYDKTINVLNLLDEWKFNTYSCGRISKILFVDMCRKTSSKVQLHGILKEYENCFIGFSSLKDTVSYTKGNEMSKFTRELVDNMKVPGLTIQEIFQSTKYVLGRFYNKKGQLPICYDSLINDIYLLEEDQFDIKTPKDCYEKGKKYIQYSYRKNHTTRQRLVDIGVRLIRNAADMGIDEAKIDMGYFCTNNTYLKQYGIKLRDYELACKYYKDVSEVNQGKALCEMACNVYLNEFHNNLYNPDYAEQLLIKSFETYKYYDAAIKLGYFYQKRGDDKKAFFYFDICAEKNIEEAMYRVGEYYEKGILEKINEKKSIEYYEKAYMLWKLERRDLSDGEFYNAICLYKLAKYYHNNNIDSEAKVILNSLKEFNILNDIVMLLE